MYLVFWISYLQSTILVVQCSTSPHYYKGYDFHFSLVAFYLTPYITAKHNNNNGMRHETWWLDCTIDRKFNQNESDCTRSSSSSYDWRVLLWISLFSYFLLCVALRRFSDPLLLPLLFCNSEGGYSTIIIWLEDEQGKDLSPKNIKS